MSADVEATAPASTFADLGLRPELLQALTTLGYEEPTPIQQESIPPLLAGRDLLGQAATGTGKTAAFALPLLQRLGEAGADARVGRKAPMALILVPTRELAMQVSEAVHKYGRELGARVVPVYGGQPIVRQLKALERGVDVVVATPGRALDLLNRRSLTLDAVEVVVLDEADEMLDMGFAEDLDAILSAAPAQRQTLLFSATMPTRIRRLADSHLREPALIEIERAVPEAGAAPLVRQTAYVVARAYKPAALGRILDLESPAAAIVFCRTRDEVDTLTETLNGRGYRAEALHGGMSQEQRSRVLGRLKAGTAELLVATDVAARGLDIDQLTHVVNYDVPSAAEAYVHRIGRVGRAGREGVAITLAQPREHRMLRTIERVTRQRIAVERLPTVADLRARRLELTRAALEEVLIEDDGALDPFRVVVESLAEEHDVVRVALAAVRLAHEATAGAGGDDEEDIPEAPPPGRGPGRPGRVSGREPRGRGERGEPGGRDDRREGGRDEGWEGRPPRRERQGGEDMTRVFVGAGRKAGVRPQDLVGAIAGETSLSGRQVGAIEITDRFSLVEVPEAAAREVIAALRNTTIKGRKATIRRDRGPRA